MERRDAKRRQILAAAAALFRARGFDGTSTDAVAAQARVSKETLYRHYPSKEQLLVAAMREVAVEGLFTGAPMELPDGADQAALERAMCALVHAVLDRILTGDYLALVRLLFAESGRRPALAQTFRRLVPQAGAEGVAGILASARRQGLLRADVDLGVAGRLFVGPLLAWMLMGALADGGDEPPRPTEAEVEATVRLFLRGVSTQL
ncbi:MAG TPA: TetR/AcrR family transcriptional regulator [Chloroflexota bacterium]|jgi:TetR/AcrR family transcriptional regulator of autoinduction and epiphytic fitness|nr:TetR/AcrR family transcriptional regulator [Chloroflexota bacterium]